MEDEPSAPPPHVSQICEFINKNEVDNRVFKKGERVCVRGGIGGGTGGPGGKEVVMATVVDTTGSIVNVFMDTDFPYRLAQGIDLSKGKYPLGFLRFAVGKVYAPENPGPKDEDPAGGRRRRRSRRQRKRRSTRRR